MGWKKESREWGRVLTVFLGLEKKAKPMLGEKENLRDCKDATKDCLLC